MLLIFYKEINSEACQEKSPFRASKTNFKIFGSSLLNPLASKIDSLAQLGLQRIRMRPRRLAKRVPMWQLPVANRH